MPIGLLTHFLLHKAYTVDEMFFSVFIKYVLMDEYIPATSRATYTKKKYKGK